MIIVGGTYFERCAFPEWDSLYGSGLRAAIQLSNFTPVQLYTFASPFTQRRLARLSGVYDGIDIKAYQSPFTYIFDYVHSLGAPFVETKLDSSISNIPQMQISGERLLVYGFMENAPPKSEATPKIDATWAVYDPQSSEMRFDEFGTAKHLAIVMNAAEARVWGGDGTLDDCAQTIARAQGAEVVVVKNGPYGALVYGEGSQVTRIPAYKTDRFFKIGSGDVFSSIFAYLWTSGERSPKDCATLASKATAYYVSTKQFAGSLENLRDFIEAPFADRPLKIYLAGPFFTIGERWAINDARDILRSLDVDVFSPIHDVGVGIDTEVAEADLAKLQESDLIFAIVSGGDPGTLFEVGYGTQIPKPVVAFYQNARPSDLTMLTGSGCHVHNDLGAAIYDAIWRCMSQ